MGVECYSSPTLKMRGLMKTVEGFQVLMFLAVLSLFLWLLYEVLFSIPWI
jgi:hypothetical protein